MPRSLQILRARTSAISVWRGTGIVQRFQNLLQDKAMAPHVSPHPGARIVTSQRPLIPVTPGSRMILLRAGRNMLQLTHNV